jgi:hypothetical protein
MLKGVGNGALLFSTAFTRVFTVFIGGRHGAASVGFLLEGIVVVERVGGEDAGAEGVKCGTVNVWDQ